MASAFKALPAELVLKGIFASAIAIALLIAFIVFRRWYRGRYFQRLNRSTLQIRAQWPGIVNGSVPPQDWRANPFTSAIVESILLDSIEVAGTQELPQLLHCLRASGLLDERIYQARHCKGWSRRVALVALGRTRAPEAVPALAEALNDAGSDPDTRMAAIRGLGRSALPEAAVPIIEGLLSEALAGFPEFPIKNALANCCRSSGKFLVSYLPSSSGPARELLARVLGELASPELGDELLVLATDPLPEVRASAARALAHADPDLAFPTLSVLANDPEWFVRLRAVVAVGSLTDQRKIRVLLRAVCDLNRHVRQRAATVLAKMEPDLQEILAKIVATEDRYALQAFISELDRSGRFDAVVKALESQSNRRFAAPILLHSLERGKASLEMPDPAAASPKVSS
ncbi:MAG TPA: HEAT repeat domain-containing protein [Terriglobales bacterium]|nr:HEAT repeat domain-containing protein [Terriglobales bacterium]